MKPNRMSCTPWAAVSILSVILSVQLAGQPRQCSISDFQACKSCLELAAAVDYKRPGAGEYYRGMRWNGLFSAYVLNCPVIAAKLLKAGANPVDGGESGSMILSVVGKWPHDNQQINEHWVALIATAGAKLDDKLPFGNIAPTTRAFMKQQAWYEPGYFQLLMLFD